MKRRSFLKSLSVGVFTTAAGATTSGAIGHHLFEHIIQTKTEEAKNGGDEYTRLEQLQDESAQKFTRNTEAITGGIMGLITGLTLR